MSTTTNTAPALLTDERLIACIRSAAGPAVPMGLLRDRGPYEVTEPTLFARNLASLIEREVRAALAQQQPAASGAQPDERSAFEDWAIRAGFAFRDEQHGIYSPAGGLAHAWEAWQARAALAAAPAAAPFGYMDQRTLDSMSKLSPRGYVMPVITRSAFDDCTVPVYAGAAPAAAQPWISVSERLPVLKRAERTYLIWSERWSHPVQARFMDDQWWFAGEQVYPTHWMPTPAAPGAAAPAGEQQP
jgi:hypothetical protein